jgi:hypothetical protein
MAITSEAPRRLVAEFHKDSGGRLTLFALTTIEDGTDPDGREYSMRKYYDVERSHRYGYVYHCSGMGGGARIAVSGIYFATPGVEIKEEPTQLVDARDKPPWRGKRTRPIRKRNKTRRLRVLPKAFTPDRGRDLLDWLEVNGIDDDAIYCASCRDYVPGRDLCEHSWWCNVTGWYSTPSEPCKCENRVACGA